MMTVLEEQLTSGDPQLIQNIAQQLEEQRIACRRQLARGAEPARYKQWQQQADAIAAAQSIFNTLRGKQ